MTTEKKLEEIHKDIKEIKNILTRSKKEGKLIICDKCGYSWSTSSDKNWVSCPKCSQKTKNEVIFKGFSDLGKTNKNNIDKNYQEGKSVLDLKYDE